VGISARACRAVVVSPAELLGNALELFEATRREQIRRFVNAGFAAQQEAQRKRRVDTLATRVSGVAARALGLPEDTVSDSLGALLGTSRQGAHVAVLETFRPFIGTRLADRGIKAEVKEAAREGMANFKSTLGFVTNDLQRERLERTFAPLAKRRR